MLTEKLSQSEIYVYCDADHKRSSYSQWKGEIKGIKIVS